MPWSPPRACSHPLRENHRNRLRQPALVPLDRLVHRQCAPSSPLHRSEPLSRVRYESSRRARWSAKCPQQNWMAQTKVHSPPRPVQPAGTVQKLPPQRPRGERDARAVGQPSREADPPSHCVGKRSRAMRRGSHREQRPIAQTATATTCSPGFLPAPRCLFTPVGPILPCEISTATLASQKRNSLGLGPLGNPVARPSASSAVQPCAGLLGKNDVKLTTGTALSLI